jgi:hypothetical protein
MTREEAEKQAWQDLYMMPSLWNVEVLSEHGEAVWKWLVKRYMEGFP